MKIGVRVKMNVSQIDKARLFKGNKGVYLDATVFIDVDQKDQYDNNGMITQDISKEEKEQGVQGNILGNVQVFWSDNPQGQQPAPQQQTGFQNQPQAQGGFQKAARPMDQAVQQNVNQPEHFEADTDIPF